VTKDSLITLWVAPRARGLRRITMRRECKIKCSRTSRIKKETCINSLKRIWVKPEKGQIKPERLMEREKRKAKD
jgi:hypothetical protein